MNYLAHLFLSGTNQEVIFGNMLEDFISGRVNHPRLDGYSDTIKTGIVLHREIDVLMDTHPLVRESKKVFNQKYGRYSSIIMDVLYDHFLIKNWSKYTSEPFDSFRPRIYEVFTSQKATQPAVMKRITLSMVELDWLKNYEFTWGLERAFMSVDKRLKKEIKLIDCIPIFEENYEKLNVDFNQFFPIMQAHCDLFLNKNGQK